MITVVGMGRKQGDLTLDGKAAIERAEVVVVKSARTHAAKTVAQLRSDAIFCDDLYQSAADFDSLNRAIAERLRSFEGNVTFCVVGDGSDDTTVALLGEATVIPGVGLASAVMGGSKPSGCVEYTAQDLTSATRLFVQPTVVTCIDDKYVASEVLLKLQTVFDNDAPAVFCCGKKVQAIALGDLLGQRFDYQSALLVLPKPLTTRQTFDYYACADIMTVLCSPNGCPWDREQTHKSIIKNVIEEAYELADALQQEDTPHVVEELGDLLMQVLFHLEIAANNGEFNAEAVYSGLCRKLIDRHPHVFGDVHAANSTESLGFWEQQKLKEHRIKSTAENVSDVPRGMSALMRCQKVSSRASKGGYEFENAEQAAEKVKEELAEFVAAAQADKQMEGGDLLFAAVNLLRLGGVDAETALLVSTEKFVRRVTECERLLAHRGQNMSQINAEQFELLWKEAKENVG